MVIIEMSLIVEMRLVIVRLVVIRLKTKRLKMTKLQKKNHQKTFKFKKTVSSSEFLITGARLIFNKLRQAFVKILILYYFNLKRYIWIKIDALGYAISKVFNQLI